jgi:hypothetical protein
MEPVLKYTEFDFNRSMSQDSDVRVLKRMFFSPHLLLFVFLVTISATRLWMGTRDTELYISFFNSYSTYSFQIEPGFALLITVVKMLGGGDGIFLFSCAMLGIGLKYFSILKHARFVGLSLLMYFVKFYFLYDLVQIRAGIAVGIIFWGIRFVINRKFIPFVLIVIAATSFHYSAIVFLCLYPLGSDRLNSTYMFYVAGILVPVIILFHLDEYVLHYVVNLIPRLELYTELLQLGEHSEIRLFNPDTIIRLFMFIFLFLMRKRLERIIPYFNLWLRMLGTSLIFFFLFRQLPVVAFRLSELFDVAMIFMYPAILIVFRNRWHGYTVLLLVVIVYIISLRPLQSFF